MNSNGLTGFTFPRTLLLAALLLGLVVGIAAPASANPPKDGWSVTLGAGIGTSPRYEGSKDRLTTLVPVFDITYKAGSLILSPGAVVWTPIENEHYSIGTIVTFDAGRKAEKGSSRFDPGSDSLKGLGDIKATVVAGVVGRAGPVSISLLKAPGGRGHGGALAEIGVDLPWEVNDRLTLSATPSLTWMDKRYARSFFSVTPTQSLASGKPVFEAGQGVKTIAISFGARYRLNERWSLAASASVARLASDIAKSPIVEKRDQVGAVATVQYTF